MKKKIYLLMLLAVGAAAAGCKEDKLGVYPVPDKGPDITGIVVHNNASDLQVPGELSYSLKLSDKYTLSTLDVSVDMGGTELFSQRSIIYKSGNTYTVDNEKAKIPFLPNMADGIPVTVKFLAINVPGGETMESVTLNLKRPVIGDVYMFLNGAETGVKLTRDAGDQNLYRTNKGSYPSEFQAIFANAEKLDNATIIWIAAGDDPSIGAIGDVETGQPIKGSFPTTIVDEINFNVLTFRPGVEGEILNFSINNVEMVRDGGLLKARVDFTKDAAVPFSGFSDMANAYNPDFFTYDESSGELRYIRESATWDVYYSIAYNYLYVVKDGAVAPEAYWIVGNGFNSASHWNNDFGTISWATEVPYAAYMVKIADNTYQASVYLRGNFAPEFYANLSWGKDFHFKADGGLTGPDASKFFLDNLGPQSSSENLNPSAEFVNGYYRLTLNTADKNNATMNIEMLREEPLTLLDVYVDGTKLTSVGDAFVGTFDFTQNATVTVTGIDNLEDAYNRDMFSYAGGTLTFLRATGEYRFAYYPDYDYTYVWQDPADEEWYPDAYRGTGWNIGTAPGYPSVLGSWDLSVPVGCYIPKIAENTYQVSLYVTEEFELEIYSNGWEKDNGMIFGAAAISGPAAANVEIFNPGEAASGIKATAGYTEGLYRFVFDTTDTNDVKVTVTAID